MGGRGATKGVYVVRRTHQTVFTPEGGGRG